ncbi:importin-9-like isoform X1 [Branchiostoma lanceolatum]|uniref:importin-9-like isoform X1 n=1 Tax=Branchiostoma lanceolatum TaxID=7740 RepID=UPI003453649B
MAAQGADVSRSLKEALLESLTAILSPQHEVRIAGEEQIKVLEVTEEFGVHLAEFTVDPQGALAIRQLASVVLKQYVETHWSAQSEKFRPPETTEQAKHHIRQLLPIGLKESISKVRSSVAYAISAIAHWDWPEAWPDLFLQLMQALTSGDFNAVHGAMRVLTEFTREVTDAQMPQVAPVILPEMYKIFTQAEVYSIRTRGRAVEIFTTCANLIYTINEINKGAAKTLLFPVLNQFVEALGQALSVPDGPTSDSGLRMEVLKALTALVKNFPKQMLGWMAQILPAVWTIFTQSASFYVSTEVNNAEDADDPVDSDGEVLGFENLIFSIFDFIHGLIETPKFRSTVKKSMRELIYYIIPYMQITEEQIKVWTENPDQFVEDEDDDTFSYSVRISAQDLLLAVSSEFQTESAAGITAAVTQHLQEAEQAKNAGSPHWWKLHESCMLALGSIKSLIIDMCNSGKIQFDLNGFLTSVVLADLNMPVSPFLLGRALWAASRFTLAMSPELVQRFLEATVNGLQPNQSPSVRISAVRAIFGYCDHLKQSGNTQLLVPYLPHVTEGLISIATQYASEVLALVLETLRIVLTIDHSFTASYESKIIPLSIAVFLKYNHDPLIASLTEDIFKELASIPTCQQPLQQRLLPTLISIMQAPADKVPHGLCSISMDILCGVVRSSATPLSDVLISQAFPACAQATLRTDDNSALQSGGECIRAYVSVACEQIIAWHDDAGNNGIYYVIQVALHLLDPRTSEFCASFVGKLLTALFKKAGERLGDSLDMLLRAVLSKLQQAETLSVIQSLVMVFAHLMHTRLEDLLEFLCSVPGPTGNTALEFVLSEWCEKQHLFYGAYEGKVSSVALSKLLSHGISKNNDVTKKLQEVTVKGDQIFNHEGIRTRSKAASQPEQWTMVPVLVKLYKLLINELSSQIENNMSRQASAGGEDLDDEEGWDDDDDDDAGDEEAMGQTLSQLLDVGGAGMYGYDDFDDEEEDDPDAAKDELNQVDLQAYLTDYLQQLAQQPCHSAFLQHLTDSEKRVLASIGIPV